jgi:hypothetical protein
LDQSNAENPLERFRRIELYIRWMEESAAPEAPDSEVATQHNCGIWAKILPPSSHRFSAQERPIQYGSEGLDSIEHLELITRVNKCGETQMDE